MDFQTQDLSATTGGSALAIGEWWDIKRIRKEILANKALFKKAGFYPWHTAVAAMTDAIGEFRWVSQIASSVTEIVSAFNSTEGYDMRISRLVTILAGMVRSTLSWEEHHSQLPHNKH
jgi:hypothetical protein